MNRWIPLLLALATLPATSVCAQVAVRIDRTNLDLVSERSAQCEPDFVIFVNIGEHIRPVCTQPPEPPAQPVDEIDDPAAQSLADAAAAAAIEPPLPTWTAAANVHVRDTLAMWLPDGWTLAWDTAENPVGVPLRTTGSFLDAVAALFATREQWTADIMLAPNAAPPVALEARAFPNQQPAPVLQVQAAPQHSVAKQ